MTAQQQIKILQKLIEEMASRGTICAETVLESLGYDDKQVDNLLYKIIGEK